MYNLKYEFSYVLELNGIPYTRILTATTLAEVVAELRQGGIVNKGEIRIIKSTYEKICDEPFMFNTNVE